MIHASVNLQKPIYKWYQPNLGSTAAEVKIGDSRYQLARIRKLRFSSLFFELRDMSGNLLNQWELKYKWNGKASMSISSDLACPVTYHQGYFGRIYFCTATEKIPAFLNLTGEIRTFQLGEMSFQHSDYQSTIKVTSPSELIHAALIVADLLFNYPYQNDNTSGG